MGTGMFAEDGVFPIGDKVRDALNKSNMADAGITDEADQEALIEYIEDQNVTSHPDVRDLYEQYYYGEDATTIFDTQEGRFHWDMNMLEVITGLNYIHATML